MSYNYHTQGQNYSTTGQTNPGTSQHQQQYNQYTQHQTQSQSQPQSQPNQSNQGFNDPFFNFGNEGFNMDIREDFEDPFSQMGMGNRMGLFGFPDIASIEGQMLGHFQNDIQNMQQLTDGNQNNQNMNKNQDLSTGNMGENQGGMFISMQGAGSGPGTMISKTYLSKIDYSGGQPKEESYQSQAIKQFGEGGHSISERQEAYKNSMTGIQKAAHQRLLDDKGTKLIKQRNVNTGEQSEHNILKGIQESEVSGFNKQYNDYRDKVHFQDNYKYLNSLNPGKMMKQLGQGKGQGQTSNLMLGNGQNQNNYGNYGNNNTYQPGNQYHNTTNQTNQYYNTSQNQHQSNTYNPYPNNQNKYHRGY